MSRSWANGLALIVGLAPWVLSTAGADDIRPRVLREDDAPGRASEALVKGSHVKVFIPSLPYLYTSHAVNGALLKPSDNERGWEFDMATSYEQIDATTYQFTLRKGARFQDGTSFTADAVVMNMEYFKKKPCLYSKIDQVFDRAEKVDEHTVRFLLTQEYGCFLNDAIWLQFYTEAYLKKFGWNGKANCPNLAEPGPYGLGPYVLKEGYIEGDRQTAKAVLVANPFYWDKVHYPKVETITVYTELDSDHAKDMALYEEGGVDIAIIPPDDKVETILSPFAKLIITPSNDNIAIHMNLRNGNPRLMVREVRRALNEALKPSNLLHFVYEGEGDLSPISPLYPGVGELAATLRPFPESNDPYLPETQERLRGVLDGLTLKVLTQDRFLPLWKGIETQLKRVGVSLTFDVTPSEKVIFGALLTTNAQQNTKDWDLLAWGNDDWFFNHPWTVFFVLRTHSVWSTVFPDPTMDGFIEEMFRETAGTPTFTRACEKIMTRAYDNAYLLFVPTPNKVFAVNKEVVFRPYTMACMPLWKIKVTDQHWSVRQGPSRSALEQPVGITRFGLEGTKLGAPPMKNLTITNKLRSLVGAPIVVFAALGLLGLANTRSMFTRTETVYGTTEDFRRSTLEITNPLNRLRQLSLSIVMAPDRKLQASLKGQEQAITRELDDTFFQWDLDRGDEREKAAFRELRQSWVRYRKLKDFTIDKALRNYREEAFINAIGSEREQFDVVTSDVLFWIEAKTENARTIYEGASREFLRVSWIFGLVIALATLLVGGAGLATARSIVRPLRVLTESASRIARQGSSTGDGESPTGETGDLDLAVVVRRGDEIGHLARTFHRMVEALRTTITTEKEGRARIDNLLEAIREGVGQLSTTSAEILATSTHQTAGAQEQAAWVSQTVATIDEVTQTASQASERAKHACESVQRSLEIGDVGRRAVEDSLAALAAVRGQTEATTENIRRLSEQAKAIGEIITTVNELAEQTNILALNAAIEASRAGEHGKGFAVVAGEVKALAEQSKKATTQVRRILVEIQKATQTAVVSTEEAARGVTTASEVAGQTDEAIKSLTAALTTVATVTTQIVASAGQQATGMTQINQAMKKIDQVARQNLAATRQSEQVAQDLNALGRHLAGLSHA